MRRAIDRILKFFVPLKKRNVVYTCMFGYSERFSDRKFERDGKTDFIVFTDDKELISSRWKVVYLDCGNLGPVRTSKMVKILAHKYVGVYSRSLYIDNTVELLLPPEKIFPLLELSDSPMVCFKHPWWQCIYIEADHLANIAGYDRKDTLLNQAECYRQEGYPENSGLIAGTMLLRCHNDKKLKSVMEAWFDEVRRHSYRDQMSFNYVAWKQGFQPAFFDGSLTDNSMMAWPVVKGKRIPRRFNDERYLALNPDVAVSGINPRKHFLYYGMAEGRQWE